MSRSKKRKLKATNNATGPVTPEGKAIASQNALSHGLSSPRTVLPHENQAEFNMLVAGLQNELQPRGPVELFLVRQMADAQWKLDRARKIETAVFERMLDPHDKTNSSPEDQMAAAMTKYGGDALMKIQRYTSALERSYYKAHKELLAGRKTNVAKPVPPAQKGPAQQPPLPARDAIFLQEMLAKAQRWREERTKKQNERLASETPADVQDEAEIQNELLPEPIAKPRL